MSGTPVGTTARCRSDAWLRYDLGFDTIGPCLMSFAGIFNLGGGEIILILTLTLILVGAKKLPELGDGLRTGFEEFVKQTPEVTHDKGETAGHPFLMAVTIILAVTCLILVLNEISK